MRRFWIRFLLLATCAQSATAQVSDTSALFLELKTMDSLIFEVGYNQIDSSAVRAATSADFEMYHDQQGFLDSQDMIVRGMQSLEELPFKARRELVEGSLEVFPLYERGSLYGAMQTGRHTFYAKEAGKPERITSTARFMNLWIKEENGWKMRRTISYDHQEP